MKEFESLSEQDRINVYCRMNEIKSFGQETFWQETGCHPEESHWTLVAYAMRDEQLITEEQYRGIREYQKEQESKKLTVEWDLQTFMLAAGIAPDDIKGL